VSIWLQGFHPRTEQKVIFEMLCNEPDFQVATTDLTNLWSLKKRWQQGRKFLLVVNTFGENSLHAVPELSVTRLDAVITRGSHAHAVGARFCGDKQDQKDSS
jgi:hypothetical protein